MSDNGSKHTRNSGPLWYESLPEDRSWFSLWSRHVHCVCGGIRSTETPCPVCGEDSPNLDWVVVRDTDDNEYRVFTAYNGAECQCRSDFPQLA